MNEQRHPLGLVAIGRNEGGRLKDCLASAVGRGFPVVYVDSGSTDGSPVLARSLGAQVVDLDLSRPFSAARARNEGLARLTAVAPDVPYVQFLDGDCVLAEGWIEAACAFLALHPDYAVACGRLRERHPETSVYNQLCDLEWDTPVGEAKACGGIAMMRVEALRQVGSFDAAIVAGEEPELCHRLREKGWKIYRLDQSMCTHDAAIVRFGQWWRRAVRTGYGSLLVYRQRRHRPDPPFRKLVLSARFWGVGWPVVSILLAVTLTRFWGGVGLGAALLVAFAVPGVQVLRIARRTRPRAGTWRVALAYGFFTMLAKLAYVRGQLRALTAWTTGRRVVNIEYKAKASTGSADGSSSSAGCEA